MEAKLSILFYSKTSKTARFGLVSIYLRVTINGVRFEQTTQRYAEVEKWSVKGGKLKETMRKPGQLTISLIH
jgi:hypothetical protein